MNKVYYDEDADLNVLQGGRIAIVGYGNQGRAQALNMRDSGLHVIVGSVADKSFEQAKSDGFEVMPIEEAARQAQIICLLVPDEAQQEIYETAIAPAMGPGKALDFAHGYNVCYGFIAPPPEADVIMVAPRMIGVGVRDMFVKGGGAPAYIAVGQDGSGKALDKALALAKAIGATRSGAMETTFIEETEIDHFMEQAVWAALTRILVLSYEFLVEEGYSPEMVALELYGSREAAEVLDRMAETGLFRQMNFHSRTSQYGTLSRGPRYIPEKIKETMQATLEEIRTGVFAREWEMEQRLGYPVFNKIKARALSHPLNEAEDRMWEMERRGKAE
ncbi:MAG: ketol-acid reductoisomerase [Armatimonadetes bacterium]|nr:ketol-acid reductoisomerase [Armatimonadota bacterium]